MLKFAIVSLGATMISTAALADEPFVLGAEALDGITAAGNVNFVTDIDKDVDINKDVDLDVDKEVQALTQISGNLATAEASADAVNPDGAADGVTGLLAETDVFAQVTPTGAFSFAEALAGLGFEGGSPTVDPNGD